MKYTFEKLWQSLGRYRKHIGVLGMLAIVSPLLEGIGVNAVVPLMSFFLGGNGGTTTDFITKTIQNLFSLLHIPFSFRYLLGFILALFIIRAIANVIFGYIRGWVNSDFMGKESEDVMRRTLLSSWPFLLKQKIGTMHNTLVRDVQQTNNLLGSIIQVIQSFSGLLMYLLVAVNISPVMTFYAIGGGFFLLVILRPLLRKAQHLGQQTAGVEKQFAQFLSEHIIGMKSMKAGGVERSAIRNGAEHIALLRKLLIRQALIGALSTSFFQPFAIILVVLLFMLTYHTPQFNIISFGASLYLIQKIFTYLESGQNSLQSVKALLPYATNLTTFKHDLDVHREVTKGLAPFVFNREIIFKDVSFYYHEGKPVLSHLTFSIQAGEIVGLIGQSGAGKTSIADLLLRLFTPNTGTLLLDDTPSDHIDLETWRKHIGYVSQDVFLLNDTLEENIRFYNEGITKDDIERAAKQANIFDFIMNLPEGFQTITGDRGVMLSGGQRQRIALARALAGKPTLLILDEATSALDNESEKLIHEAIHALHGTLTVFIIAHRLSTVMNVDKLLVLREGKIEEEGRPLDLLQNESSYFYKINKDHATR